MWNLVLLPKLVRNLGTYVCTLLTGVYARPRSTDNFEYEVLFNTREGVFYHI